MTLGATTANLRRLVLLEVLASASFGVMAGSLVGMWLSRSLSSFLYGITPADPMTLTAVIGGMGLAVVTSAWWPTTKTAHLNPAALLKTE